MLILQQASNISGMILYYKIRNLECITKAGKVLFPCRIKQWNSTNKINNEKVSLSGRLLLAFEHKLDCYIAAGSRVYVWIFFPFTLIFNITGCRAKCPLQTSAAVL